MVATVFGRLVGCVSKDMTYVALVLYPLAAFCSWLLWCVACVVGARNHRNRALCVCRVCCWMHQWHPLVYPIYPQEE